MKVVSQHPPLIDGYYLQHQIQGHTRYIMPISRSMWLLGRYAHAPIGDHDGHAVRGYFFTSILNIP
jgi:hypothetical protein